MPPLQSLSDRRRRRRTLYYLRDPRIRNRKRRHSLRRKRQHSQRHCRDIANRSGDLGRTGSDGIRRRIHRRYKGIVIDNAVACQAARAQFLCGHNPLDAPPLGGLWGVGGEEEGQSQIRLNSEPGSQRVLLEKHVVCGSKQATRCKLTSVSTCRRPVHSKF